MSNSRYALLLLATWTFAVFSTGCASTVGTLEERAKALQLGRDEKAAIAKREQESKEDAERCSREVSRSKGYQPINPIPVDVFFCQKSTDDKVNCRKDILRRAASKVVADTLPNETMRLAIGQVDITGSVQFGPLTGKTKLGSYIVILDYIKYTSIPIMMHITDKALNGVHPKPPPPEYIAEVSTNWEEIIAKQNKIVSESTSKSEIDKAKAEIEEIQARKKSFALAGDIVRQNRADYVAKADAIRERQNNKMLCARRFDFRPISRDELAKQLALPGGSAERSEMEIKQYPLYIGVGVRMTAVVSVNDASANLSSFYQLALAAERKQLTGTLVIQTLGISGQDISPFIPMPSEINVTTIQNAIQSLATIKAKLYGGDKVELQPQVVSFEDEAGRPEAKENVIDAILSGQAAGFSLISLSLPDGNSK